MTDARDVIAGCVGATLNDPHGHVKADAILSALAAAGWVVVPREPTEAMLLAAGCTPDGISPRGGTDWLRRDLPKRWRAMIAAAKEPK